MNAVALARPLAAVLALAGASAACQIAPPMEAQAPGATAGEWVVGGRDLRKVTALVRVTPPERLKATMETVAARIDDPDVSDFLRAHASGGFGSGALMVHRDASGEAAFVVTNRHVVAGAEDAEITFADGTTYKDCEIVYASPRHDLAVVALPPAAARALGGGLRPATAEPGERLPVIASGYPGVAGKPSYQVTDGKISNARFSMPEVGVRETVFQHTAAIDPGSSGGPLTSEAGDLVGLNVSLIRSRNAMFFAVPAAAVADTVRHAHGLLTKRRSAAFMTAELEGACKALSAEIGSASANPERLSSFVSNQLVAEQGFVSYQFMATQTSFGPLVRRVFFEAPIDAMHASVVLRMILRTAADGGVVPGSCAPVHPSDSADVASGKPVRLALRTKRGEVELRWVFEHGAWRVAGGDLLDVVAMMEEAQRDEPAVNVKTRAKGARKGK